MILKTARDFIKTKRSTPNNAKESMRERYKERENADLIELYPSRSK